MLPKTQWGPRALTVAKGIFPGMWEAGNAENKQEAASGTCQELPPAPGSEQLQCTQEKMAYKRHVEYNIPNTGLKQTFEAQPEAIIKNCGKTCPFE